MSRQISHIHRFGLALLFSLTVCSVAQAGKPVKANVHASGVSFSANENHSGATLTVTGPNDYYQQKKGASVASLGINDTLADGLYTYEITLEPREKRERPEEGDSSESSQNAQTGSISSGSFRVVNGVVVNPNITE